MTVRSALLATNDALGGSVTTLYTTPSARRTIVKSIICTNLDSSARAIVFYLMNGATELASFNVRLAASGSSGDTAILSPWFIVDTGQTLKAQTTGGTSRVIVSGAELVL